MIFKSIGIDTGTRSEFVVGYFFEGDNGLFAFTTNPDDTSNLSFTIALDTSASWIEK